MLILDTNVLSALMDGQHAEVIEWLDKQDSSEIWITTVTVFEVEFGIQNLPEGRKRDKLQLAYHELLSGLLKNRILTLEVGHAVIAGEFAARERASGNSGEIRDLFIAGIAAGYGAKVVTRNVKHFERLVEVVNPWGDS